MSRSNLIKLNLIWPAWVVSWLSHSLFMRPYGEHLTAHGNNTDMCIIICR